MTTQEQIAELAAELTRIGKMPWWVEETETTQGVYAIHEDGTNETVWSEEAVLSALLGVAAEAIATENLYIVKSSANPHTSCFVYELIRHDWMTGTDLLGQFDSYPKAVIAALKQIESEARK